MSDLLSAPISLRAGDAARGWCRDLAPGLGLCAAVAGAAILTETGERAILGRPWLEALVLAILLGAALRSAWAPPNRFKPGIEVGARTLLEVAVMLLGASVDVRTVAAAGPAQLVGIAGVLALALPARFILIRR